MWVKIIRQSKKDNTYFGSGEKVVRQDAQTIAFLIEFDSFEDMQEHLNSMDCVVDFEILEF